MLRGRFQANPSQISSYVEPESLIHHAADIPPLTLIACPVIFAAGTGNPFFTTDTAAALRAAEMGCDALMKGTSVDGVYSADPKTTPDASRFEEITFTEVLTRHLKIMDAAAIALARDNNIPIIVFSIRDDGGIVKTIGGDGLFSVVQGV